MAYTQGFARCGTAGFGVGMEEFCFFNESFLEDGNEFWLPGCLGRVGVNPEYVIGVWVGNADGEGRPGTDRGYGAAAPILFEVASLW